MKKMGFLFFVLLTIFMCSCAGNSSKEKLKLYEEVSNHWKEFFTTDQFSMVIDAEVSTKKKGELQYLAKESTQTETKICKSPFYLEVLGNGELTLIQEEQGKLYSYKDSSSSGEKHYLDRVYFGEMDSIDDIEDSYYAEDPLSGLPIDDMEISFKEAVYTFKITMYDLFKNTNDENVKEIIASLDIDDNVFKKFWVTLSMTFSENAANMKIKMECEYEGVIISIRMDTKFNSQEIKKIDLQNNPYYILKHPNTIDGIYQFSSIGKTIHIPSFTTNYFKFDLEKGQYGVYATNKLGTGTGNWIDDWALGNLRLELYDENKKEIPMGMGMDPYATEFTKKTFYISESGTYYLRVWSNISCTMDMCVNKLNYDTIGFESAYELTTYKGKIEGEYDFDVFTINGKENEILVFKNTGLSPIPLIYFDYQAFINNRRNSTKLDIVNNELMVRLKEGKNQFIISSDFQNQTIPFEYEFIASKFTLENGYEENYEDLKSVTTDYSNLTYLTGTVLPNPRLSLSVETKSIIDFKFQYKENPVNIYAIVKDLEGNPISSISGNIFELDPGKYIVEIMSFSSFEKCKIKYIVTEIEDKEIDVTLEESSLSEFLNGNFPTVESQNVGRTQKVKCNFAIREGTLIASVADVMLYHKDGTPVFNLNSSAVTYLEPGEYYYMIEGAGTYYKLKHSYKIAIVTDKLETASALSQMKEIKIGQKLVLKKEWKNDQEYLILNIQEEGIYRFNQEVCLYNDEFNIITYTKDITLNAGTYYICYSYPYDSKINQETSIVVNKE